MEPSDPASPLARNVPVFPGPGHHRSLLLPHLANISKAGRLVLLSGPALPDNRSDYNPLHRIYFILHYWFRLLDTPEYVRRPGRVLGNFHSFILFP